MTDTPEDIRAKAEEWCLALDVPQTVALVIAQALMEERERCARICDDMHFRLVSNRSGRRAAVAYDLADAIRNPTP